MTNILHKLETSSPGAIDKLVQTMAEKFTVEELRLMIGTDLLPEAGAAPGYYNSLRLMVFYQRVLNAKHNHERNPEA